MLTSRPSPAEVLPLQIREKGLALGNCFYWLFQFMMVEITPIAIENIYYKFYIVLAVFNICIAVVIWLAYPETANLSLEELDLFFVQEYRQRRGDDVERVQDGSGHILVVDDNRKNRG